MRDIGTLSPLDDGIEKNDIVYSVLGREGFEKYCIGKALDGILFDTAVSVEDAIEYLCLFLSLKKGDVDD